MKLMSTIEYSDYLEELPIKKSDCWDLHRKHVEFLKQILEIWMFVPAKLVNGEWVVLEEPEIYKGFSTFKKYNKEYQEAKERVLFEGFEVVKKEFNNTSYMYVSNKELDEYIFSFWEGKFQVNTLFKIVEDCGKYHLELTQSAIKQIGL